MSWLRLDDGFASHPKIAGLTDYQFRAWIKILCHCAKYRTPVLRESTWRELSIDLRARRGLTSAGLIDSVGGELRVHDWEQYQPKDRTGAERQARWRQNRNAENRYDVTEKTVTRVTTPSRPVTTTPTHPPELQDVGGRVAEENGGEVTELERIQALEELRAMRETMTP